MEWLGLNEFAWIGLIWMFVLGPAVGNYACSVVYRLPRGKTPFERHPFCGHCNADLKPIDLFPIFSWLSTRGKCRYCKGEIPAIYTAIEVVCGAVFMVYYLRFGISEPFLLYSAYAVFVVILAAIHWQQGWISAAIYSYAIAFVWLARTLAEGSIYGAVQSAFITLVVVLALYRAAGNKASPFEKPWIWWFVLLGALLPVAALKYLVPVYLVKLCFPKRLRVWIYSAVALTLPVILPLLT